MTIAKATRLHLMCRSCQNTIHVNVKPGLNGLQLPRICDGQKGDANQNQAQCPLDPFLIVPDTRFVAPFPFEMCDLEDPKSGTHVSVSLCVDQQTLKIQEAPDMVPVGELPRYMLATVDRSALPSRSPFFVIHILLILFFSRKQQQPHWDCRPRDQGHVDGNLLHLQQQERPKVQEWGRSRPQTVLPPRRGYAA